MGSLISMGNIWFAQALISLFSFLSYLLFDFYTANLFKVSLLLSFLYHVVFSPQAFHLSMRHMLHCGKSPLLSSNFM